MGDVLIDLGELPRAGARPVQPIAVRRSPRPYRTVLAALALVLLAGSAGAQHVGPAAGPKIVAARLSDALFVGSDRFYVISAGPEMAGSVLQTKVVSAYGLPDGNLLSLTTVAVSGAIFDVTSVGRTILVSYQVDTIGAEATVALVAGTDTALWRRPARLLGVSASDSLVLLRENSPLGDVHWYGIDLASGVVRWQLGQPARGYLTEAGYLAGFPRSLVSVDAAGRLELRDAATGAVTATRTIPVPDDWAKQGIALWSDDDLILVGDHTGTTAYALPHLTERWRIPVDLYSAYVGGGCGDAVCFFSPRVSGIRVVDRATGRDRWASARWSYADQAGPYLLAGADGQDSSGHTLAVVDAGTGRVRGDFGPWHSVGSPGADGTVIGLRERLADNVVWYARLDPARLTTRLLGVADHVSGDCQTTGDVLICRRVDSSVGIWQLNGRT